MAVLADEDLTFAAHLRPKPIRSHPCAEEDCLRPALLTCGRCHAVKYCCRRHQEAHFPEHKALCKKVAAALKSVQKSKDDLIASAPSYAGNPFETQVGHFWGIWETRAYMRARTALIDYLRDIGTPLALSMALNLILGGLRLNRGDNQGIRYWAPGIFLRLNMDQECYDFCRWWSTCDPDGHYDWGDGTLPYLSEKGADITEKPTWSPFDLDMLLALVLLKHRALQRLKDLERFWVFLTGTHATRGATGPKLLAGKPLLLTHIQDYVGQPKAGERRLFFEHGAAAELELLYQVVASTMAVKAHNQYIITFLKDDFMAEQCLKSKPSSYSHGSPEEAFLAVRNIWPCWKRLLTVDERAHLDDLSRGEPLSEP